MLGKVKWFNEEKGFGFITSEEGQDIFVHYSQIKADGFRTLQENQKVEFMVSKSEKGLQATDVYLTK
jgi:CspA family cold shock protein